MNKRKESNIVICSHCKRKIKYKGFKNKDKPEKCKYCKHQYSMKPPIEYKLFILQDKVLKNKKDLITFNKFYKLLFLYTKKLLLKKLTGKIFLNENIVTEKVHDTVTKLYEYYTLHDNFRVEGSFAGYINKLLLGTLYNRKEKKENDHDSLNYKMSTEKSELIDLIFMHKFNTLSHIEHDVEQEVLNKDKSIINEIYDMIVYAYKLKKESFKGSEPLRFLEGIIKKIDKHSEKKMEIFYDIVPYELRNEIEKFMLLLKEKLERGYY